MNLIDVGAELTGTEGSVGYVKKTGKSYLL